MTVITPSLAFAVVVGTANLISFSLAESQNTLQDPLDEYV